MTVLIDDEDVTDKVYAWTSEKSGLRGGVGIYFDLSEYCGERIVLGDFILRIEDAARDN